MLNVKLHGNSEKVLRAKIQGKNKPLCILKTLLFFFLITNGISQSNVPQKLYVDYYGVISPSSDSNMTKMAQDMFFTQLKSFEQFVITDKRDKDNPITLETDFSGTQSGHIVFFAEIKEIPTEDSKKWNCTLHALDPHTQKSVVKSDIYESYYRILSSIKPSSENLLADFIPKSSRETENSQSSASSQGGFENTQAANTENLAGTWSGENDTNKIVILRGGRGFVIFKNGASMNIAVKIDEAEDGSTTVEISQVGRANASFYPGLSREIALEAAANAPPIVWKFTLENDETLSGTKNTLVSAGDKAEPGTVEVTWTKKN